jgi:hypothetical protein
MAFRKLTILSLIIVILALAFSGLTFNTAQAVTEFKGIINADTTWTKANSPYSLTGNVLVNQGITLKIEAGVTVIFKSDYDIHVNGTLVAEGTTNDPIVFSGDAAFYNAYVTFASVSKSWDEQSTSGCIVKNAIFLKTATEIVGASPKITNSSLFALDINGGQSVIEYNQIAAICIGGATKEDSLPIITNNNIDGSLVVASGHPTITNNIINGFLEVERGTSTITSNIINQGISVDIDAYAIISGNQISGKERIITVSGYASITNNRINSGNNKLGIYLAGYRSNITGNSITNCSLAITGYAQDLMIHGNSITDNRVGIYFSYDWVNVNIEVSNNFISRNNVGIEVGCPAITIKTNTITDNQVGISIDRQSQTCAPTIENNNIYSNRQYGLSHHAVNDITVKNNWWGTTDNATINQQIYDYNDDFEVGKVYYMPYLQEANPQASSGPNQPLPTPLIVIQPTTNPTTVTTNPTHNPSTISTPNPSTVMLTPNQTIENAALPSNPNWLEIVIALLLSAIVVLLAFVVFYLRRRSVGSATA